MGSFVIERFLENAYVANNEIATEAGNETVSSDQALIPITMYTAAVRGCKYARHVHSELKRVEKLIRSTISNPPSKTEKRICKFNDDNICGSQMWEVETFEEFSELFDKANRDKKLYVYGKYNGAKRKIDSALADQFKTAPKIFDDVYKKVMALSSELQPHYFRALDVSSNYNGARNGMSELEVSNMRTYLTDLGLLSVYLQNINAFCALANQCIKLVVNRRYAPDYTKPSVPQYLDI